MTVQNSNSDAQGHGSCRWSMFGYLIAGLGIGAVAGILMAPQSGEDSRDWVSGKYKDGMDAVNAKVKQTGRRVSDMLDQGQQQVSIAVDAGREAFSKAKAVAGL
jgi:gas vesicle protein